jgi:hypothetical protein
MPESVRQDLPATRPDDHFEFRMTEEQGLVIRKAAELIGWTVPQYVLSTVLDRAERDLYEYAASTGNSRDDGTPPPADTGGAEPYVAILAALG